MAILFGLLAAFLWGLTDFLAQRAGKAVGVYRTMFYGQVVGVAGLGAWMAFAPDARAQPAGASPESWVADFGAALIGLCATLSLYQALLRGRIGTVVPIAASYGAVGALLAILSGERVSVPIILGLACCIIGAVISALPARGKDGGGDDHSWTPIFWAIAAALAYGTQFWLLGRYATPQLGAVVPVLVYYATGLTLFLLVRVRFAPPIALPQGRLRILVLGTAFAAIGGYVAISAGLATGEIAIVTVLSAFQSGVTVLIAWMIVKERLAAHQIAGVALVVAGLVTIHAFE